MRRTCGTLLTLIGTLWAHTLDAQHLPAPGARVRVLGDTGRHPIATGTFVRLAGDTVILSDSAGTARGVTLEPGRRWEISTGMHRRTLQGMGIGLLIGAGTGALLGAATYKPSDCGQSGFICLDFGREFSAMAGAVLGGVPGILIGAAVGSKPREGWRPLSTDTPRVALLPTGSRGAAFTVSFSF